MNDFLVYTNFLNFLIIAKECLSLWIHVLLGKKYYLKTNYYPKHHYLKKEDFDHHLNIEHIIDVDYGHAERVCKDFEIKKLKNIKNSTFNAIHFC